MRRETDNEERRFLREHIPGRSYAETAALFNAWNTHFPEMENRSPGSPMSAGQVRCFAKNHKIRTGRELDTRFKKGQIPYNKGKYVRNSPATEFKKGNKPHNHCPVGSTVITSDGYTKIKVAEPNKWRMLHILMWEQACGPIPAGHVVIFGDGNRRNITLNNLILVTRAQLARMNQQGLIGASAELTKTGALVADLWNKTAERKRKRKERTNG